MWKTLNTLNEKHNILYKYQTNKWRNSLYKVVHTCDKISTILSVSKTGGFTELLEKVVNEDKAQIPEKLSVGI